MATRFETVPITDCVRGEFYDFHRILVTAVRAQGYVSANEDAARLAKIAYTREFWETLKQRHATTLDALRQIAQMQPRTFLDDGIDALVDGRPGDAIRLYGRVHTEKIAAFTKYRTLLAKGPDRGLAVWQVMNPFYLLWAAFPVARKPTQDRWRENQFNNSGEAE